MDGDGSFATPGDQVGDLTGFFFDSSTGRIDAITGSTRQLTNGPSDLRFSSDGERLIVSSCNAGSAATPDSDGTDSLVVYAVGGDGTLSGDSVARAASTLVGNAEGRNLPSAIGITTVERAGETILRPVARERPAAARSVPNDLGVNRTSAARPAGRRSSSCERPGWHRRHGPADRRLFPVFPGTVRWFRCQGASAPCVSPCSKPRGSKELKLLGTDVLRVLRHRSKLHAAREAKRDPAAWAGSRGSRRVAGVTLSCRGGCRPASPSSSPASSSWPWSSP